MSRLGAARARKGAAAKKRQPGLKAPLSRSIHLLPRPHLHRPNRGAKETSPRPFGGLKTSEVSADMADAITDWEDDLRYLYDTYYVGHFNFAWPSSEVFYA